MMKPIYKKVLKTILIGIALLLIAYQLIYKMAMGEDRVSEATSQITINMPREKAWEILKNFSVAHNYVPGIIDTEIITDKKEGVGASRLVYQSKTKTLQETITEWNEGFGFRLRLHKGDKDSPFKNAFFSYKIEDVGDNQTRLTNTMGYTPPMGGIGVLIDNLFLNKIISGVIRDVTISMKSYYETGQPTTPADLKKLKAKLKR